MRPPALGYRLRAGIRAYGTSNVTNVKLLNQDSKLNARHSASQRDRWQGEYVHSLRIRRQHQHEEQNSQHEHLSQVIKMACIAQGSWPRPTTVPHSDPQYHTPTRRRGKVLFEASASA